MLAEIRAAAARREAKARCAEEPSACGKEEIPRGGAHSASAAAPASSSSSTPVALDIQAQINKYKTMLRVGIRLPSVLRKMGEDAFDITLFDQEIDRADIDEFYLPAFLASTHSNTEEPVRLRKAAPQSTRKKIHIPVIAKSMATLKIANAVDSTTLWDRKCKHSSEFSVSAKTRAHFDELFTFDPSMNKHSTPARSSHGTSTSSVLIDKVRAQNIAILLVGMKISTEEWRQCILNLTFEQKFSENLKMLLPAWPTSDEWRAIQAYNGDVDKLGRAESFFVGLRDIPRLKKKFECLHFRLQFSTRVFELREAMLVVIRAINQIVEKETFAATMQHIFRLCCILNNGDTAEDSMVAAKGFRISALTQLLCARSLDPKVSVLRAMIEAIERDHPRLGTFAQELTLLNKCASVSLNGIHSELISLESGYSGILDESMRAGTIKLDATDNLLFVDGLKTFLAAINSFAAEADLELQGLRIIASDLHHAVQRLNSYLEEPETTPFNEVISHIAAFVDAYVIEREKIVFKEEEDEDLKLYSPPTAISSASSYLSPSSSGSDDEEMWYEE